MEMMDNSTVGQIIGGKKQWPKKPKLGGPPQHCSVCNLDLSSTVVAEQHFQGKNHMKNLKRQDIQPTTENTPGFVKQEKMDTTGQPKVKQEFKCDICELTFTSEVHTKSHLEGQKHAKKVMSMNKQDRELTAEENVIVETLECKSCGVTLTSPSHAKTHVLGVKHALRLKNPRKRTAGESVDQVMAETNGNKKEGQWECALCELTFNSEVHSKSHFDGARHAKRILAIRKKQNYEGIKKLPGAQFFCSFCEENLASKEVYEAHIISETHKANLAKKKEETQKMLAENKKPFGNFECVDCKITFKEENLLISHYDTEKHKGVIAAKNQAAQQAQQAAAPAAPKPILKNSAPATPAAAAKPATPAAKPAATPKSAPANTRGYNKGKHWVSGGTINK